MKESILKSITRNPQANLKEVVMKAKIIIIAMFAVLAGYGIAGADYLLIDQEHVANVDGWYNLSYKFGQEFTPSVSSMDMVSLALHVSEEASEGAELQINIRNIHKDPISGDIIYDDRDIIRTSDVVNLDPGFTGLAQFNFASPIELHPGTSYIIDLELKSGTAFVATSFEGGGYTQGLMYIYGHNTPTDNSDLIFQTGNVRSNVVEIISGADVLCRSINSNDKLIIAILSNDVLNAALVDPQSLIFAGAGVKRGGKNGRLQCRQDDSNNDGLVDLVCSIEVTQLVIEQGASSIDVTARTYDGMKIEGDEVLSCSW